MSDACPFLVSLSLCGYELQGFQMLTRAKRIVSVEDTDSTPMARDHLRHMAWDPEVVRAQLTGIDPSAHYELEVICQSEPGAHRVESVTLGDTLVEPSIEVAPGPEVVTRIAVPPAAVATGSLSVAIGRVDGPDVVVSELRLYSSVPAPLLITVVGDSCGGLLVSVSDSAFMGVSGAGIVVQWSDASIAATTDANGLARIPLRDHLPLGQHAVLLVAARSGALSGETTIDTRCVARGLREVPPDIDRLTLTGAWSFAPGTERNPFEGDAAQTRVPGHVIFDGLVPDDGVATMWQTFDLPESWLDGAVFVRFDGAYGQADVYVNDVFAGKHGSGATSFDFDISGLVRAGANTIAVTLTEYGPHSVFDYMSWYAHMSLLGIWRDVYLFRADLLQLGQLDTTADWDHETRSASLRLGFDVINLADESRDYELQVRLEDGEGRRVARKAVSGMAPGRGSATSVLAMDTLAVDPWSAEDPRRYVLRIEIVHDGRVVQTYEKKVGFRRVEVVGNELRVNGAPIRILGVNRHDARMNSGRALTVDQFREDVLNFRRGNVNTIRTSHYPADPRFAELCDELGMYLFDEAPICWMGFLQANKAHQAAHFVPYLLEVTAETVRRDKGHCSVLVWDLANESEWSFAFSAQLELVKQIDASRPTIFSFDLNELAVNNQLEALSGSSRPELRSYHYPGLANPWAQDLARFATFNQPVILDEYIPIIEACQRFPHEAYVLPIDPGVRDYWVTAIKPFMKAVFDTRSCIGGMVWSGIDDLFAIPLDLNIGEGPWAHLPKHEFLQQRDLFRTDDSTYFRGDGEWGLLDAWGRPRAELWHLQKMYSPIEVAEPSFDGTLMRLTVRNRFAHLDLDQLRVVARAGGTEVLVPLSARPGRETTTHVPLPPDAGVVQVEFRHPEGWIVDGYAWSTPIGEESLHDTLRGSAESSTLGWPELHVHSADRPDIPVALPVLDLVRLESRDGKERVPFSDDNWTGWISVRRDGGVATFDYEATYLGEEGFNAREVGLSFTAPAELTDLWWRRDGEWSYYPASHIGRNVGYATPSPRSLDVLKPTRTWEEDGTRAGSTDYRSAKRNIRAGGLTDGRRSFSVLSPGTQAIRAELRDGRTFLHVLDWYGGVRTKDPVHPVWSAYFGAGKRIDPGTVLGGSVTVVICALPADLGPRPSS